MSTPELPDKLFFKIGEVATIVGVRPHVLRYWESEFPNLKPMKTRGAHRVYRRRDVELAVYLRRLLHEEGYTIAGARKRLKELGRDRVKSEPDPGAVREAGMRAELLVLRKGLSDLLEELDRVLAPPTAAEPERRAKVTRATPNAVPVTGSKTADKASGNPCSGRGSV